MLYKNLSVLQTCFALLICLLQQYVLSYRLDYCNPSKPNTFGAKLYLCFINYILSNPCFFIKQSFAWFVFLNPTISYCFMASFNQLEHCFRCIAQRKATAKVKMYRIDYVFLLCSLF